jgi:hypothetical protein
MADREIPDMPWVVFKVWNTDFEGRKIDPTKEEYPVTVHGLFENQELAETWMNDEPDDTDTHDVFSAPLNPPDSHESY